MHDLFVPPSPGTERVYWFFARVLRRIVWRGQLLGAENLPRAGPAVFFANHLNALGPISCVSAIPLRFFPWMHAAMLDRDESPTYLRWDFVERELRLKPPLSPVVARILSRMIVHILHDFGCIPVYRGEALSIMRRTWEISLSVLFHGRCLLIFPENKDYGETSLPGFYHLGHGFLHLADLFYKITATPLPYYPVAVHPTRRLLVGEPLMLTPNYISARGGKVKLNHQLEELVIRMFNGLS